MDRRTYTFIVASAAFLFFYLSMRQMVVPPDPPPEDQVAEQVEGEPATDDTADQQTDSAVASSPSDAAATEDAQPTDDMVASTAAPKKWFTLGSMNPADGHNLLITFRNYGAGIERIELTARDAKGKLSYRRVDTSSGYLGYFAGATSDSVDGVTVNVVGPGTPAALAKAPGGAIGIQVGDVIVAVNNTPVTTELEISEALRSTEPGDVVPVEVLRSSVDEDVPSQIIFDAELNQHPLDLVRLAEYGGDDQIVGNLSRLSCLMTLAKVNRKGISVGSRSLKSLGDPEDLVWTAATDRADDGGESIRFETTIGSSAMEPLGGQPVRMVRTYRIRPGSFLVDMDIEIQNLAETPQTLAYRLEGPNGITAEGWWYSNKISPNFSGAAARDIVYQNETDGHSLLSGVKLLKGARKTPEDPNRGIFAEDSSAEAKSLKYIGVDAQYFAVAYFPTADETALTPLARASATIVSDESKIESYKEKAVNSSFFIDSVATEIAAGESAKWSLRMYAGPKEPALLDQYGLGSLVYYGWFSLFSTLLAGLLHFLQSLVGNYGISIVLLTVVVRGLMFPLSRNAAVNAQRMQELAPEMKKIAEKYKDDMEGRLKAQQALQKRVGFNPLSGCLPMFLQLPIFMGLYRALSVDIELRQEPLFSTTGWVSNLAGPDQWMFWGDWMIDFLAGRGNGYLGPYLNLLPVVVVALFLTQQKMFMPPATDEQTAMTQKMMTVMTMFMGLLFFRVPAGLCIYFISSSLWGIGERLIVKKTLPTGKHFDLDGDEDVIDAVATTKSKSEKMSLAERMMQQVKPAEEPPPERPNKRKRPPGGKKKKR